MLNLETIGNKPITVAITGHRPNKLFGYDLDTEEYRILSKKIREALIALNAAVINDGMALGVDQLAAITAIRMRQDGYDIKVHAAIPCQNHSSKWTTQSKRLYDDILARCDEVTLVSDMPYEPRLMQIRNQFMVDNADVVLAVFDGTRGGTKNCIDYAISQKKPIVCIPPRNGETYVLFDGTTRYSA